MQVVLIRHGMTRYNEEKKYQGQSDLSLSAAGRAALKKAEFSPKTVYVSPLRRAVETAEILFPQANLVPVEGLKELSFGAFEGKSYLDMENDAAYRAWVDGGCKACCPQGNEDRDAFTERVCRTFEGLMKATQEERLVIVAHGGTQMAMGSRFCRPEKDYFSWQTEPGEGLYLDASRWEKERILIPLPGKKKYP